MLTPTKVANVQLAAKKQGNRSWYDLLSRTASNRRSPRLFWPIIIVLIAALNLYAPAPLTILERLLASAIVALSFWGVWYWSYRSDGAPDVGLLPLLFTEFWLEYGLTIFTQTALFTFYNFDYHLLSDRKVEKALALSLASLALIITGYYSPLCRSIAKVSPKIRLDWRNATAVRLVSFASMVVGIVSFLIFWQLKLSDTVQSYFSIPGDLFFLGMIALFLMQLQGHLGFIGAVVFWAVLVPARIFIGMMQGWFALGMLVVGALIITFATVRRRMPWLVFAGGMAGFIVLQPIKATFRRAVLVDGATNTDTAPIDKAGALLSTSATGLEYAQSMDYKSLVAIATQRFADIQIFSDLVSITPDDIPYWNGSSYYRLLFVPIPRILYREKPEYVEGNIFAHQYGLIGPEDYRTSINLSQVMEFYGNFGPVGVIVGSFVLGLVYRVIGDIFIHEGSGMGAVVAGIYVLTELVDIENSAASVFGELLIHGIEIAMFCMAIRAVDSLLCAYRSGAWRRGASF